MGRPASGMGDLAAHGGTVVIGSTNVFIGGRPAARKGDTIACALHGTGAITQGSMTVFINGMPAARLGDMTGCMTVGLGAISVPTPAVLGPTPAPPLGWAGSVAKQRNGKTHAENDEARGGASVLHAEGQVSDANGDGIYDTAEGAAEVVRLRNKGYTDVGPAEIGGTHSMDLFYANAKASAPMTPVSGQAAYGSAEAGMLKWGGMAGVGRAGSQGRNHYAAVGGELNMFHAKAEGDWLAGDDGNRVGIVAKGEAGAEVIKGEAITVVTSPSVFGYNVQFTQKGGAAAGTVGGGAGFWGFYNKKEKRVHVGAMAKLKLLFGLEGEWNVSLGQEFKEDPPAAPPTPPTPAPPALPGPFAGYQNTPGFGAGGLPGAILLGNPTVLIGG